MAALERTHSPIVITTINGYDFLKPIGAGAFGSVFLAEKDFCFFAIKIISEEKYALKEIKNLEKVRLKLLHHQNIVQFVESFSNSGIYYIVLEYVDGISLFDYLKPQLGKLEEVSFLQILLQMLRAIEALHNSGFVHLDLKLENFVIDKNRRVVLIDMGCSSEIDIELQNCVGTPLYMDPRVIHESGTPANPSMDIWSLSMVILFSYLNKTHFYLPKGLDKKEVTQFIMFTIANLTKPPIRTKLQEDKTKFGMFICDISTKCLQIDHIKRPSASELIHLVKAYMNS
jgi:serine/threonine protein kinase